MPGAVSDVESALPSVGGAERRRHPRLTAADLRGLVTARVKYGGVVTIVDLSVSGALIEARGTLERDANVVFEFAGPAQTILVPSRTLRVSSLAHLDDGGRCEAAFLFKRPLPLTELLREPTAVWHKVVARYHDGRLVQGYTHDFQVTKRSVRIALNPFAEVSREVLLSELDTILFLRDEALGHDEKRQASGSLGGRRVVATLVSGEVVTGTTLNYHARDGRGFFIQLSDGNGALRMFVLPWAIKAVRFL